MGERRVSLGESGRFVKGKSELPLRKVLRAEKDGKQAISRAMEDSEMLLHPFYCHTDFTDFSDFLSRIERIKELLSSQATNGSEEENKGVIIDQELIELENCYRRKRRMAQKKKIKE